MRKNIINIILILLAIYLGIHIIKISKVTGLCCMIISILSPLFFGYIISWILRPIIDKFKINRVVITSLVYILFIGIIIVILFNIIPLIIKEIKHIYPIIKTYILNNKVLLDLYKNLNIQNILKTNIKKINSCFTNIVDILINIIYSLIFGFYFLSQKNKNNYFKFIPSKLKKNISKDLRLYIRSILLDTLFMFILLSIIFIIIGLDSPILFALLCALTNIIPYIGPYIGGIPAVLIGFTESIKLGLITCSLIVAVQIIENSFVQPLIVSKNVDLNPIYILIGIILFSHFFGIIGMIISTPIILVLRNIYTYYKKNNPKWITLILDKL